MSLNVIHDMRIYIIKKIKPIKWFNQYEEFKLLDVKYLHV